MITLQKTLYLSKNNFSLPKKHMNKISCNVTDHALAISTLHIIRTAACLWVRGCLKVLQMPNECHVTVIRIHLGLQNHTVFLLERIISSTAVSLDIP